MNVFELLEKVDPEVFIILLDAQGERFHDGHSNSDYWDDDVLDIEVLNINISRNGTLLVTVNY